MGGKGSGRKRKYHDEFHKILRDRQKIYDRQLRAIANKHKCSLPEARKIRGDGRRQKKQ